MEDLSFLSGLVSYGALGLVTLYFAFKDWRLSQQIVESLSKFNIALDVLIKRGE